MKTNLFIIAALLLPGFAGASVVSPLGSIYLYDPQSFDAGVLQRGGSIITGLNSNGWNVETAVDLPLFHEFSIRLGYLQRYSDGPSGHDLTWRLRMPVFENARYGRLGSVQLYYSGNYPFASPDSLLKRHEIGSSYSGCFARSRPAKSIHGQLAITLRDKSMASDSLLMGGIGLSLRGAFLIQLYNPPFGRGGAWTVTVSGAELSLMHYGISSDFGGDGRISLSSFAPALHFTVRSAVFSLGISPSIAYEYNIDGTDFVRGISMNLSGFQRSYSE